MSRKMRTWVVTISMVNEEGKFDYYTDEFQRMDAVARCLMTFRPKKKGYKIVRYVLEDFETFF